jgi:hypothetical protein
MTRKDTRNASALRGIAPLIAVLTVMIALAALAQTRGAGQAFGKSHAASVSPSVNTTLIAQERPLLAEGGGAERAAVSRHQRNGFGADAMGPVAPFFLPPVTYRSGGYFAQSVAVSDVNHDGKLDVLVTNLCFSSNDCTKGGVSVLLGNGDGTFQTAVSYVSGGADAFSVAVADVNGDGKPDLLVANCGPVGTPDCPVANGVVGVLLGNGDGTFQPVVTYDSGGVGAVWAAVADVNGDGKPDLLVANQCGTAANCSDGSVGVLLGNGDGTFHAATTYDVGYDIYSLAVSDINGDGKLDVMVTSAGNSRVGVLLGNGDGTFRPVVTYNSGGVGAYSVAVRDVNGDGKPDLLVANNCSFDKHCATGAVGVLLGNGDGSFQPAVSYISGGSGTHSVAIADVNGDGKTDLLVQNSFYNTVGLLLGNGDGTFQPAVTYDSGGYLPSSVAAADVNGDGKKDLLVADCVVQNCSIGGVGVLLHVGSTPTTTALVSSLNPSVFGQIVTLTAAVNSSSGTPTGTVRFFDGSATLGSATLVSGSASFPVSALGVGSHSITAVYLGSLEFNSSVSTPLTQVVSTATTTTSLVSSHNPGLVGQTVTYTAVVTSQYGGSVTGTVTFYDAGVKLAKVTLQGAQARFSTTYKAVGGHSITATYAGDVNNSGSTSATLAENIVAATKTALTTSGSPSFVGQSVTFTATVTWKYSTVPDGELVTFYDGTTAIGTGATASGVATFNTSSLSAKTHTIKATYAGDGAFLPSTGTIMQIVNKYPTTTTLTSSPNPSHSGQAVTFTAQVTSTGPTPTGSVKFLDGTTSIGLATLSGGVAKLTKSNLAVGTHSITAHYNGNAASSTSTSVVVNQVVE